MSLDKYTKYKDGTIIKNPRDSDDYIIYNQFSFLNLLKGILIKYAHKPEEEAIQLVFSDVYLTDTSPEFTKAYLIAHEYEYHWAMLIAFGSLYWQREGIKESLPDDYLLWEKSYRTQHDLAEESFEFP